MVGQAWAPNCAVMACPSMDKVIKSRLPALTKSRDKQVAKQQALMLDAVGYLHLGRSGQRPEVSHGSSTDCTQASWECQHASQQREAKKCPPGLYKSAPPSLFGEGFCKKAKERDEELKCLNQATGSGKNYIKPLNRERNNNFFRGGRTTNTYQQPRGRGRYDRGWRGRSRRNHPYRPDWSRGSQEEPKKN